MEKRVVITGIGAVTPVGNDIPTTWESLLAGKNGIGKITKFDTSNSKVNIAAEVKGFDPLLYIEKSQVRKMDLFTQYAMAAAAQAMQDSGIEGKVEPERLGVYIGVQAAKSGIPLWKRPRNCSTKGRRGFRPSSSPN